METQNIWSFSVNSYCIHQITMHSEISINQITNNFPSSFHPHQFIQWKQNKCWKLVKNISQWPRTLQQRNKNNNANNILNTRNNISKKNGTKFLLTKAATITIWKRTKGEKKILWITQYHTNPIRKDFLYDSIVSFLSISIHSFSFAFLSFFGCFSFNW